MDLGQIYLISALAGSIFIVFSFAAGHIGDGGADDGAGGGHDFGASDDAGAGGHDFGAVDDAGAGGHDFGAVDDAGAGGHDFGAADNPATSSGTHPLVSSAMRASTGSYALSASQSKGQLARQGQEQALINRGGLIILGLLSPMGASVFLAFFGLVGLLVLRCAPVLGPFSLIPAILVSTIISNLFKLSIRWMMRHFQGTSVRVDDLVGRVAEVNTPIKKGATGEITYLVNQQRQSSAAKSIKADLDLERGTKVMIVDVQSPILLVEPYTTEPWEETSQSKR